MYAHYAWPLLFLVFPNVLNRFSSPLEKLINPTPIPLHFTADEMKQQSRATSTDVGGVI